MAEFIRKTVLGDIREGTKSISIPPSVVIWDIIDNKISPSTEKLSYSELESEMFK